MSGNGYYREVPKISRRAPTIPVDYPPMSPSLSSPNHNLGIPSAPRSNASSNDSFVEQAFVDFSDHAFNCDRCYDPLRTHLDGGRLCRTGRHLGASVKSTLRDETRALKRHSRSNSDEAYIRIPKGCEPVQQLLIAMQKGLHISTVSPDVPTSPRAHNASHVLPSPPASPRMTSGSPQKYRHDLGEDYSYDSVYYVPARKSGHSDEEVHTSRRSRRHSVHESDGHRMRRSHSSGPRNSSAGLGIEERERRPYGLNSPRSSADKVSVDSGYDSNNNNGHAIPDIRRGSQYTEDMRRRHGITIQPTKSALRKRTSFEEQTGIRMPSSPNKLKGVGFDLGGEYKVPGYD